MKIGIKYCGGCNPRFDREKIVERLTADYSNVFFEFAKENNLYDFVIIINGCNSACASHENLIANEKLFVNDEVDYINIKETLDKFI